MKFQHTIRHADQIDYTVNKIREWVRINGVPKSGLEVKMATARTSRSLSQNAISHAWYATVSAEEKEYSADQVKRRCKYHMGLPILMCDDKHQETVSVVIDNLPEWGVVDSTDEPIRYRAMDLINVSSVMTKKQMTEYLEAIQRHYAGRVKLEFPDD